MLKQSDTIGIVALSGNCDREKVAKAKENLEALGYKVKFSKNIYNKNRYLSGSDDEKVRELHNFFEDDDIKLILCARGGYGSIRIINKIDYDVIESNPKPFCGFSDVTALLLMIYKKTGITTYHSPMACSDFGMNDVNKFTAQNFFNSINNNNLEFQGTAIINNGEAQGIIWGGNLATVVSLCGQDFLPDKDFLFFTEDLNEPVYKIDKMFQQLLNISEFVKRCKGIILGDFLDVDNKIWLEEYFQELSTRVSVPIVGGFKITHSKEKITLPIGRDACLSGLNLQIKNS